jgi:hypothetical protein
LAARAHRAEGQCLLDGQTPNNGKSLRLLGGIRRLTFSRRKIIIIIKTGYTVSEISLIVQFITL